MRRTSFPLVVFVLLGVTSANGAPVQITANAYHDMHPELDGATAVWQGEVGGITAREIFWSDVSQSTPPVTQITTNNVDDRWPHVSGTTVVWEGEERRTAPPPLTYEIFKHDTGTTATTQITTNSFDDFSARVSGSNIVWRDGTGPSTGDIWLDAGTGPTMISSAVFPSASLEPQVDGNNAVWRTFDGNDWEIFHYDVATTALTQLTNQPPASPVFEDRAPDVNGNKVVWTAEYTAVPGTSEIHLYDLASPGGPIPLTSYGQGVALNDGPQVDDTSGYVVWYGDATGDQEIYLHDLNSSTTTNISNRPGVSDKNPQISGSLVVWQGIESETGGDEFEIFLYDILTGSTYQLTNDSQAGFDDQEPKISGTNIVWQGRDPQGTDLEIFYFDASELLDNRVPEPSALALLVLAAGCWLLCTRRGQR